MKIDCISDKHWLDVTLPSGDLLLMAGDMLANKTRLARLQFHQWIESLGSNYQRIILVAGNHDPEDLSQDEWPSNVTYLQDSGCEYEGLKIWGTPWSLYCHGMNPHCASFTGDEEELKKHYDEIPDDIDILISHGPMKYILDQNRNGISCGSISLRDAVDRVKPKLLVTGHIHESCDQQLMYKHQGKNSWCVNASICDENYEKKKDVTKLKLRETIFVPLRK